MIAARNLAKAVRSVGAGPGSDGGGGAVDDRRCGMVLGHRGHVSTPTAARHRGHMSTPGGAPSLRRGAHCGALALCARLGGDAHDDAHGDLRRGAQQRWCRRRRHGRERDARKCGRRAWRVLCVLHHAAEQLQRIRRQRRRHGGRWTFGGGRGCGERVRRTSFIGAVDSQCPRAGAQSGRGTEADRSETVQEGLTNR